jgi:DNA polymerase-4
VTEHDLYAGGLNFVFGLAECPGRAALISLYRLGQEAGEALFRERALKEALHELGHSLSLGHCPDSCCVMHFSNCLADTDRKGSEPCARCTRALARAGSSGAAAGGRSDGGAANRRILHVDMDAFFAAAEMLRHPELAAKAVVVGGRGDPTRRGVVSAASYGARRYGIRSGMPLRTAFGRCPTAVFLPVDLPYYRELSGRFKTALREFADLVEDAGLDEAYADLTHVEGSSEALGRAIKARIREATGLTGSVGIAPNKLLAKLASDLDKPDGLTILGEGDLEARIWPLEVRVLQGVGPKTQQRLGELGVRTVGDLAQLPVETLVAVFGPAQGRRLHESARGVDERPLVQHWEPKSRGRETTFEQDVDDSETVARALGRLAEEVAAELHRDGQAARVVTVKLRFADFETHTHRETLPASTDDVTTLRDATLRCLGRFVLVKKVRLVGVRVGGLQRKATDASEADRPARLLVTARGLRAGRQAAWALREAVPEARVRGAGFGGILLLEASGDALALAAEVTHAAAGRIGRAMAVLAEVESARGPIEEAAVAIGRAHVGPGEGFCFRLHKRGTHALVEDSPWLEREIGGAIWSALHERDGKAPRIDLTRPDVTVSAEVLGPRTAVCVRRRAWRERGE